MAHRSLLTPLVFAFLFPLPALAAEIALRGRVLDDSGAPVVGARVDLLPVPSMAEEAKLWLAGRPLPDPAAQTRTGPDGGFEITAPDLGSWQVRVEVRGFLPVEAAFVPLTEERELDTIVLEPDATLPVRVVDPHGRPLAGARVWGEEEDRFGEDRFFKPFWHVAWRWAKADASGVARLPRRAEEELRLSAYAPGYPILSTANLPDQGAVELRAVPGCVRRVEIRDAAGDPVAGAMLMSDSFSLASGWVLGATAKDGDVAVTVACDRPTALTIVTSEGSLFAAVKLTPVAAGEPPPAVELELPRTVHMVGSILTVDRKEPVAGALVWLAHDPGAAVRTDARGLYALTLRRAGRAYELGVAALGGTFDDCPVTITGTPGRFEVKGPTLWMSPFARLEGTVVDRSGAPVAGARVVVNWRGRPALSDAEGRFEVDVPAQSRAWPDYRLFIVGRGFVSSQRTVRGLGPGEVRSDLVIVLERGRQVVGKVADSEGRPIAGAEVIVGPEAFPNHHCEVRYYFRPSSDRTPDVASTLSDGEGRFSLLVSSEGNVDLGMRAAGLPLVARLGIPIPEGTTDLGTVVLTPGFPVEGVVVDHLGQPIEGAEVQVREAAWFQCEVEPPPPEQKMRTGPDGRFAFDHLSGAYLLGVLAEHPGYRWGNAEVQLPASEPLRIVLQPKVWVIGRVVDPDGKPVKGPIRLNGMRIESPGSPPQSGFGTYANKDGTFALDLVGPEQYALEAMAHNYLPSAPLALAGLADLRNVELRLRSGEILEGRVTRSDGKPVAGASIRVFRGAHTLSSLVGAPEATTDGNGRYRLTGLLAGPHTLQIGVPEGVATVDLVVHPGVNQEDFQLQRQR